MRDYIRGLLTEAPMDFGDMPPAIDREKRRKIERNEHPYAANPAFPQQVEGGTYAELTASEEYARIVNKIGRSAGLGRAQLAQFLQNPHALTRAMMTAFQRAMQFEAGHEAELERAAVELVLSLPEFEMAREAYEDGDLRIEANLVKEPISTADMAQGPEAPQDEIEQAELQIAQVADELNAEKDKRRIINMMIQGAAINKNHAYHLIADRLNQISPQMLDTYGLLMSAGEYMYWAVPEEMQSMMMGEGGGGAAGKASFSIVDGVPTIHAEAVVFPVLVQELVKGLMEFLSYDEDDPDDVRRHVGGQVDTLPNEVWDIMMGPASWRRVLNAIGTENQRYMPSVYSALRRLPPGEFSRITKALLSNRPEGLEFVRRAIADAKQQREESVSSLVRRVIGG